MILIITEVYDVSTNDTIDWIASDSKFIRINKNDLKIISVDYEKEEIIFKVNSIILSSKSLSSFWYRRGYVEMDYDFNLGFRNSKLRDYIFYHLNNEWNEIIYFFTKILQSRKSLGTYQIKDKKLKQLYNAHKSGLNVPKSLVTNNKKDLILFYEENKKFIITKGINSSPSFSYNNISLEGYTEEVTEELITALPNEFFPSFFQENILKQYELRIFFLKGKFYTMAIFSQNDEQTRTDLRKYNDAKPNKTVPYELPFEIKEKLTIFMNKMNLDTGSIDMIVDTNDIFYFLEVNPNGQFGMVSTPCNYYIEKEIAEALI